MKKRKKKTFQLILNHFDLVKTRTGLGEPSINLEIFNLLVASFEYCK